METKLSEILIEIYTFLFKMSSGKWRSFVSASMCYAKIFIMAYVDFTLFYKWQLQNKYNF